jgi:hypothetical protein
MSLAPDEKSSLWKILNDWIPQHYRPMLGVALATALIFILSQGPFWLLSWLSRPKVEECWDIKQVGDNVIKFNKCTGQTQPIDMPPAKTNTSKDAPDPSRPPKPN